MIKMKVPFEKTIAFHPCFAKCFGSINKAIYLQQLIFWSNKGGRNDGFVYKTKEDIAEETTLTRNQQDKCRKYFIHIGLLKTRLFKANGVPTLHYKVNIPLVEKSLTQWCETHESNSKKSTKPLTESTTEKTTENNTLVHFPEKAENTQESERENLYVGVKAVQEEIEALNSNYVPTAGLLFVKTINCICQRAEQLGLIVDEVEVFDWLEEADWELGNGLKVNSFFGLDKALRKWDDMRVAV